MIVDRDAFKWAAWLLMAIDHAGSLFAPELLWPRVCGRFAYPFFLLLLVDGVRRSRNVDVMLVRIFVWASISQPVHWWAFGTGQLNVLFGLAAGAACVRRPWWVTLLLAIVLEVLEVEYGAASVIVLWWSGSAHAWAGWGVGGAFLIVRGGLSVLGWTGVVMPWLAGVRLKAGSQRIPRWLSYGFYPAHLAAFAALRACI